ncbi:MAG: methyltransferase domain-containing protein [Anaerolineales bacterium]
MSELSIQELEKVAETYERLLVPALFEEWAHRLADAAEIQPDQHVLDVACGTGILARTVARRTGAGGWVSGVDINPGMVAVAKRISPDIDWREGSAEALPYEDEVFDAVICQFGLMLFSNSETALQEMMRVLKSRGNLAVAVFDSLDNSSAYAAMADVYARVVDEMVGAALRFPFSMGETDVLASRFAAAGISNAVITSYEGMARFSNVRNMVLADVKGWFPLAQIHLDEPTIEAVVREAEEVLQPYLTADGAVEFRVPGIIITATKP